MREIGILRSSLTQYLQAKTMLEDLEMYQEFNTEGEITDDELDKIYQTTLQTIDELELLTSFNDQEDRMSCVLEVNSGAGGTESCDWAEMLMRMYIMWAEKNGFKVRELNAVPGNVVGYRSVSLEIEGDLAFGFLKGENGVHRLVRISPFNAQGKRQTTFASIYVYPLVDDTITVAINPADIEMDVFRASGAGGQHVNKTESAVRLRHIPSGLVAECQEQRSQHQNREKAMQMLKSRLYEIELRLKNEARDKIEAGKQKIEWGSQVRSYVLDKHYIKDHRTGQMKHNPEAVLNGELNDFIKEFLLHGTSADLGQDDDL
jgi:peptide chain release factor 2